MKIITYLSKQWTLERRDYLKSLFYTVSVPVLTAIQALVDTQLLRGELTSTKLIIMTGVSAGLSHILRKLQEPHKLITMQKVEKEDLPLAEQVAEEANEQGVPAPDVTIQSGNGDPIPPPIGDPTHPKEN